MTVAKEIENANLLENVNSRGKEIRLGLRQIINDYPNHFNEVRGVGLMQGLVIKEGSHLNSQIIAKKTIEEGLLTIGAGPKVIRIVPPLIIKEKEVNQLILRLNKSIKGLIS